MKNNKKRASYLISVEEGDHEEPVNKKSRSLESCNTSASSTTMQQVVLPRDLIINEILTRVSLQLLVCQCRLVCKDWQRLTYESNFILTHSQRTPTISGYLLWMVGERDQIYKFVSFVNHDDQSPQPIPPPPPPLDLDFLPLTPEEKLSGIVSSSSPHGLFLCSVSSRISFQTSFYVCKPATREWRKIPSPRDTNDLETLKISIVVLSQQQQCDPLHYKIIRLGTTTRRCSEMMINAKFRNSINYCYHLDCEIFDSNNWEWKTLNSSVGNDHHDEQLLLPSCFNSTTATSDPGVLVHGAVHWLSFNECEICALNINNGNWKIIALPRDEQLRNEMHDYVSRDHGADYIYAHQMRLVECEGELGLLYLGFNKRLTLELWVLKDYSHYHWNVINDVETITWNKIYLIDLGPGYGKISRLDLNCSVLQLYTKDIVLMKIEDEVIWYNHKTGIRTLAYKIPSGYWIQNVHPIHSDLLPCNM
ncbi:hypothetical protein BVC80_9073g79 [Macleaya cordata]|uniref:F-box domain n=1 Tax=Macleaya cordata TaxID=56857 RepID=A0A200PTY3_MACCD|nr:hypothetical protein BVC80_9073g79 [Macleaya cordata]